ncbi:nibrin isoform X2 [Cardiocondyla obscurior]|uniref:nibrin isoform X2 n=1 Tax=Cardiocondyla obscurior TaxID=286306 RepID=UPI0039656791
MWCFKGPKDVYVYILPNQQKSFGKSLSDIKLEDDVSISRLHAIVSVEPSETSQIQSECTICDKSKYGTFLKRKNKKYKLSSNTKFVLNAGDVIQFGLKDTIFLVLYHSFIIAKSSLNEGDTNKLRGIAHDLQATLFESWKRVCTHLTVPEILLFTPKLAYALASAKPIVTIAYWEKVLEAIKEFKKLPEIDDFLPNLKEKWVTSENSKIFLPNEERKTLFKGLSFIYFCANQYSIYAPLIAAAGGKSCIYPTKKPLTPRDLIAKNAIVIQQSANDSLNATQIVATDYPIIYRELKAAKRRMISDTEIPLAILRCTTEMYCNPTYTFAKFLNVETQKGLFSDVISEDTQDIINTNTKQVKRKIIPETCEFLNDTNVLKKIGLNENESNVSNKDGNIDTIRNTNNKKIKCKIIPETCNSQITNISGSSSSFYENEIKCISNNESNISMNNTQSDENKSMKRETNSKTYNFQNKNILTRFFHESEENQCYLPDSNESNTSDVVKNIFSDKNSNAEVEIVFDRSKFEDNFTTERQEPQNDKSHENLKINKKSAICKNVNLEKETTSIADEVKSNDKENSKNTRILHVAFTKETNHNEINITKGKENNLLEKDDGEVELQDLKKQNMSLVNETRNRSEKIKDIKKDKVQTKNNKIEQILKTEANKTYLNQGSVDKILRKDVPCGKKFKKIRNKLFCILRSTWFI